MRNKDNTLTIPKDVILSEERSDEAICFYFSRLPVLRLLRFARNDSICECIKIIGTTTIGNCLIRYYSWLTP